MKIQMGTFKSYCHNFKRQITQTILNVCFQMECIFSRKKTPYISAYMHFRVSVSKNNIDRENHDLQ